MKTVLKILLSLFFVGLILIAVGFATGHEGEGLLAWFSDDGQYGELLTHEIEENVDSIYFDLDIRHVNIVLTDEENISFSYYEHDKDTWTYSVVNNRLEVIQKRRMTFNFGFFRTSSSNYLELMLYLPQDYDQVLNIKTAVGAIEVKFTEMRDFEAIDLETATGKIILENVMSRSDFNLETKTGDIRLKHIEAQHLFVEVSTGRIHLENVLAKNIDLKNSTGRIIVENSVIDEQLKIRNSTGDIIVKSTLASTYDLVLSTGSIEAHFDDIDNIRFNLETSTGSVHVFGINQGNRYTSQIGDVIFNAKTSTGKIQIIEN